MRLISHPRNKAKSCCSQARAVEKPGKPGRLQVARSVSLGLMSREFHGDPTRLFACPNAGGLSELCVVAGVGLGYNPPGAMRRKLL